MDNDKLRQTQGQQEIRCAGGNYFERTAAPLAALVYLLPFIALYEIGTLFINTELISTAVARIQIRVVSFIWLQQALAVIGLSDKFALLSVPLLVVVILIAMHITHRKNLPVKFSDYAPMTMECLILTVPLLVFSVFFNRALPEPPPRDGEVAVVMSVNAAAAQSGRAGEEELLQNALTEQLPEFVGKLLMDIVTGIGAGIYEELVFRLILICALMIFFENLLHIDRNLSILFSVIGSALLFSLHHHFVFLNGTLTGGEPFTLPRFVFRMFAGVYFAVIFAYRGFGIVAGTHAFYDVIAACLNHCFFCNQT